MEGTPVQELSALAMSTTDCVVINGYHNYAYCSINEDKWSRNHVHGLDPHMLQEYGFSNEQDLIKNFLVWYHSFPNIVKTFSNDPSKEAKLLHIEIEDIRLPVWSERIKHRYHKLPNSFKEDSDCIFMELDLCCDREMHRLYSKPLNVKFNTLCQRARWNAGYHCSLADVCEMFLFYRLYKT